MNGPDDFTPRLGKVGDQGASSGKRFARRVTKIASRLAKPRSAKSFSGARAGRGTGAGRAAAFRAQRFANFRMRRVTVKTHIARARGGGGKAAFRAHLGYIQRDGVDRDGAGGELYDRDNDRADGRAFIARSQDDRHQFRVIVSAEDADRLGDPKEHVRAFMADMEKDLGSSLDWVAVDHHNTGHSHTHIVIRGKDQFGKDLVIAREYITHGMRARARELVTDRLGPRSDLEIARANAKEVEQDRFTGIDRDILADAPDNRLKIASARSTDARFDRALRLSRLNHLKGLGLARQETASRWTLTPGWQDTLADLGRRGDIIRTLSAAGGKNYAGEIAFFENGPAQTAITGRVVENAPRDELRDTRALIIDATDGKRWHVPLDRTEPGSLPPKGAIVQATPTRCGPRPADRLIDRIASLNGGHYSDSLHKETDAASQPAYRLAHKRRLEAMRRAGLVSRNLDGVFEIPGDYLERVARYEQSRASAKIEVQSWIDIETQSGLQTVTWLDDHDAETIARSGFGAELNDAKRRRTAFLRELGLSDANGAMSPRTRARLMADELRRAGSEAAKGRTYVESRDGMSFHGVYERPVDLAQGRFAVIGNDRQLTLVPWRADLERQRGRAMAINRTGNGIEWTLGRPRGIAR